MSIHLDWVTISCFKNIETGKTWRRYAGSNKSYAAFGSSRLLAILRE